MKSKPYRAKTLSGAQAYVRMLLKQRERTHRLLEQIDQERKQLLVDRRTLAKLAAKGPCFYNPLEAFAAETLRDNILRIECSLTPDGKYIRD